MVYASAKENLLLLEHPEKFGKTRETSDVVALKIVLEVSKSLQVSDGGNHQEFVANY